MTSQKLTEFYAERQGRPDSRVALDMESHKTVVVSSSSLSLAYLSSVIITYEDTVVSHKGSVVYRS